MTGSLPILLYPSLSTYIQSYSLPKHDDVFVSSGCSEVQDQGHSEHGRSPLGRLLRGELLVGRFHFMIHVNLIKNMEYSCMKYIVHGSRNLLWSKILKWMLTFQPTSMGLDHALVTYDSICIWVKSQATNT